MSHNDYTEYMDDFTYKQDGINLRFIQKFSELMIDLNHHIIDDIEYYIGKKIIEYTKINKVCKYGEKYTYELNFTDINFVDKIDVCFTMPDEKYLNNAEYAVIKSAILYPDYDFMFYTAPFIHASIDGHPTSHDDDRMSTDILEHLNSSICLSLTSDYIYIWNNITDNKIKKMGGSFHLNLPYFLDNNSDSIPFKKFRLELEFEKFENLNIEKKKFTSTFDCQVIIRNYVCNQNLIERNNITPQNINIFQKKKCHVIKIKNSTYDLQNIVDKGIEYLSHHKSYRNISGFIPCRIRVDEFANTREIFCITENKNNGDDYFQYQYIIHDGKMCLNGFDFTVFSRNIHHYHSRTLDNNIYMGLCVKYPENSNYQERCVSPYVDMCRVEFNIPENTIINHYIKLLYPTSQFFYYFIGNE